MPVRSAVDDVEIAFRALLRCATPEEIVVVRLTYRQIVDGWDEVERDLLDLILRDAHRSRGRR